MQGSLVRLDPLAGHHVQPLFEAAGRGRGSFRFTYVPQSVDEMRGYVEQALCDGRDGTSIPFAILDNQSGRIVGSTRFLDIERWPPGDQRPAVAVAEIGATWLAADAQGTGINAEAKLLMLDFAFGDLDLIRVSFKTDARNERSRRAIERLGASFEGIRRAHMPAYDGAVRDSAFYSVLRDEWPPLREALARRVAARVSSGRGW